MKFLKCNHCGNVAGLVVNAGAPLTCCGEVMKELAANTTDAAVEKHVPAVSVEGGKIYVKVGTAEHPMLPAHKIDFIYIESEQGGQRKGLKPEQKPKAEFALASGDKLTAVYAYCNLHGLWKAAV